MGNWIVVVAWFGAFVGTPLMLAFWYVVGRIAAKGDHSRQASEGHTPLTC